MGLPIPLGGTSNHFRVPELRALIGWDPHNVTEDADLGLRAAVEGYRVGVIDSDTEEEACAEMRPWIRQRTRWIKGYMQTALVHMRSPRRLVRQVGIVDALGFLLLIAGTPLTFLLAPVMWIGTAAWYGFGEPRLPLLDSGTFCTIALINLLIGNGVMIALNLIAAMREARLALRSLRAPEPLGLGAPLGRGVARARPADQKPVLLGEDTARARTGEPARAGGRDAAGRARARRLRAPQSASPADSTMRSTCVSRGRVSTWRNPSSE